MVVILLLLFCVIAQGVFITKLDFIPEISKKKCYALLVFLELFLFAGLRHVEVYNDSLMYANHFVRLDVTSVFQINILDRFEIGYQFLENFIYLNISKQPIALFLITSLLIQASNILFFHKYSKVLWFSFFLYLGFTSYFFSVSAIRQSMAIAIFNFSFIFLLNKKWISYILIVLFATLFHYSAFILLFLPLLEFFKIDKKNLLFLGFLILIVFLFLGDILKLYYAVFPNYRAVYLNQELISSSKIGVLLILITNLIGLIIVLKMFDFKDYSVTEKYMLLYCIAVIVFQLFSIKISALSRFSNYFIPVFIVMLANSCIKIQDIQNRKYIFAFWVVFLTSQIITILSLRPEWFMVLPYKFYWQ